MATKYLTCAETAKLLRKALKETFPDIKFSVKSDTYREGGAIHVNWTDGPNLKQVEAVGKRFESSYVDSTFDYKGSIYHSIDGYPVSLGSDFVFHTREHSDTLIQKAIDGVYRRFESSFKAAGVPKPSLYDFKNNGRELEKIGFDGMPKSLYVQIKALLGSLSDRLEINKSKTLDSLKVTHDDGYSMHSPYHFGVPAE
ncbi:hypothetical protein XFHB_05215 [Xylella fastidiosa]|uniref:Large polyvalent protein associated domain-containing protein n=1 Tax=Xylella fastidiosa TaxID=2371 RepID=A0ABC8AD98_XYLFS|nr:LPD29 domain-containing protein [Xylella fastidiosa]ALR06288.1 hypothetical protein XFHB_04900 [Xylella fastidiosa]ALR06339.1 hypothetical protein XFHB_05215 [Xylella fastidiosa]